MRKSTTRLIPLLVLAVFLLVRPAPAIAACCEPGWGGVAAWVESVAKSNETTAELYQWGQRVVAWGKQFAFLGNIITLGGLLDTTMGDNLKTVGAVYNAGQMAQVETETRVATGVTESHNQSRAAQTTAANQGENSPPPATNQEVCNLIVARQAPLAMHWFTGLLAAKITNMIQDRYRGSGVDGDGPQFDADERDLRCGKINGVKTANPIDGYPASCVPTDPSLIDADISATTLDYNQVLQQPPFISQTTTTPTGTITVKIPTPQVADEDYVLQQRWVAAMNYCHFAAGPRPSPPSAADLNSPEGVAQMAMFDRANALEGAFISQCAQRVAYLTRPYCNDTSMAAVCEAGMTSCAAARDAGVDLPPGVFCRYGLSEYQAELLSHLSCMGNQAYTAGAGSGETHGEMINSNTLCQSAMSRWQAKLARDNASLASALAALREMRANFSGGGRSPGKTMRINVPVPKQYRPNNQQKAEADQGSIIPAKVTP